MAQENKSTKVMPPDLVEEMMVCILLVRSLRVAALPLLEPSHFRMSERYLRVLWDAVKTLHLKHAKKDKIPYNVLDGYCREAADDLASGLSQDQKNALLAGPASGVVGLLHYTYYEFDQSLATHDYGLELLQRFLLERASSDPLMKAIAAANAAGEVLTDVTAIFQKSQAVVRKVAALSDNPFRSIKRDLATRTPLVVSTTNLKWLNTPMNGGPSAPEVVGLLGMTGGGKTTLFCQAITQRARAFRAAYELGAPKRRALLFTFEDDFEVRCWNRIVASAARVRKASLESTEPLSTKGYLKPYEIEMFAGSDLGDAPGEQERIVTQMDLLDEQLQVVDMTVDGRGYGGVDEIATLIRSRVDAEGWIPGAIFIDSANLMVSKHLTAQNKDPDRLMRFRMISVVEEVRAKLGTEFNADVWMTNQFAGAQTKRAAGTTMHHSDAGESKAWANALDFAFAIGNRNASNVALFQCTKSRRTEHDHWHTLLRLDGDFARWVEAGPEWSLHQGAIARNETLNAFKGKPKTKNNTPTAAEMIGDAVFDL